MAVALQSGDIVTLRCGGPKMTVEKICENLAQVQAAWWCDWFDGKELRRGLFRLSSLARVDDDE